MEKNPHHHPHEDVVAESQLLPEPDPRSVEEIIRRIREKHGADQE